MGGFGSGRRKARAALPLTTRCRSIDIRRWHAERLLRPGFPFTRVWSGPTGPVAEITVRTFHGYLEIVQGPPGAHDGAFPRRITVPVVWTTCNLGGSRPWFRCPREGCGRKAAVLYDRDGFASRRCHRLAYPCQRETSSERALRKADRLRLRLGWEPWECSAHGAKPKGMHWPTFRRLKAERAFLMIQACTGLKKRLDSLRGILGVR